MELEIQLKFSYHQHPSYIRLTAGHRPLRMREFWLYSHGNFHFFFRIYSKTSRCELKFEPTPICMGSCRFIGYHDFFTLTFKISYFFFVYLNLVIMVYFFFTFSDKTIEDVPIQYLLLIGLHFYLFSYSTI